MKISELNTSLGAVLAISAIASYGFLYSKLSHLDAVGSMVFFAISLALLPVLLIGITVALSKSKYQKFSSDGFKVGAFLLVTLLMYVVWEGPSYWAFTLTFGAIAGGLLFALIKLEEHIVKFIYTLFGLLIVAFIVVSATTFVN
ncbi:MAG: hypothetical protein NXI10_07475 [bacterium]|nr:hypothetical protein [bacterium]